jgi:dTDP-4-amino-4,6-dideoxygalactose transaminase
LHGAPDVTDQFIPFNKPYATGAEFGYIREAIDRSHLAGDGMFSGRCHAWLERTVGCARALLTHSCTAALEMAALLCDIEPGDEIIMPSFTFVSTANAFVLRGGVPVFVDIRPDTLNLDEARLDDAITPRTRAIVPVHYAGVPCEMHPILATARSRRIRVVEDAAQALGSRYHGQPAGRFGCVAATSFHETKNVIAGEGGAILLNDADLMTRAEIVREKGTNRTQFFRGETAKYTWIDVGSSFLPSELTAAFLWAQMEAATTLQRQRLEIWDWYYEALAPLEQTGQIRRPIVPPSCEHNGHMFYVLLSDAGRRERVLAYLNANGINAVFHYVPLHSSPAGERFARPHGTLTHTNTLSARLIRLPMWIGLSRSHVDRIVSTLDRALKT